jgi:hypothetical protein
MPKKPNSDQTPEPPSPQSATESMLAYVAAYDIKLPKLSQTNLTIWSRSGAVFTANATDPRSLQRLLRSDLGLRALYRWRRAVGSYKSAAGRISEMG